MAVTVNNGPPRCDLAWRELMHVIGVIGAVTVVLLGSVLGAQGLVRTAPQLRSLEGVALLAISHALAAALAWSFAGGLLVGLGAAVGTAATIFLVGNALPGVLFFMIMFWAQGLPGALVGGLVMGVAARGGWLRGLGRRRPEGIAMTMGAIGALSGTIAYALASISTVRAVTEA